MTDYADSMLRMFHRNIDAAAASDLHEPRTREPARARRIIALLVETLGGFAYGTAAGGLARAVSTWLGAEHAGMIRRAMPAAPYLCPERDFHLVAPSPLAAEMLATLRARVGLAARDLGALAAATMTGLPAQDGRAHDAIFSQLNRDSGFEDRLEIEIRTGWTHACAAIERCRPPIADISPRARFLWSTWLKMAGSPDPETSREGHPASGYIVRVG
ncbi:hypothetical protein BH11MYX1_BH11MYX1_14260 [soil metagenome]